MDQFLSIYCNHGSKTHKVSCDIANIQDDFEYWSFSSYKNGILVKHEDTRDEILLKVLMMVDEEKPTAQTFKRIYKDCYGKNIPKELLNTYLSGEKIRIFSIIDQVALVSSLMPFF